MWDNGIITLGNDRYKMTITLSNGNKTAVLPNSLLVEFTFTESFNGWEMPGHLVYDNAYEAIERSKDTDSVKNREHFYYRLDGTDTVTVQMDPLRSDIEESSDGLVYVGSVYDVEDIDGETIENRSKKLSIRGYYYNKASNINTRVSTAQIKLSTGEFKVGEIQNMDNVDRMMPTGAVISDILTNNLNASVDAEGWEVGARNTFYVSPPTYTLSDDITELLPRCHDINGYPLVMNFDRGNNIFTLKSIDTIFNSYGENIRELFKFVDNSDPSRGVTPVRSKTDDTYYLQGYGDISDYEYVKMSPMDNTKSILSQSIATYDQITKVFTTQFTGGNMVGIKKQFTKLFDAQGEGKSNPILITNTDKNSNVNMIVETSPEVYNPARDVLEDALLLNDALYFACPGVPIRKPGVFMELESGTDTEGIWEDRFLGTWFISAVTHTVTSEAYTNNIYAIKGNMANTAIYPEEL